MGRKSILTESQQSEILEVLKSEQIGFSTLRLRFPYLRNNQQIERLKAKNGLTFRCKPLTSQSLLRTTNQRKCPICQQIYGLEFFKRESNCSDCEKKRAKKKYIKRKEAKIYNSFENLIKFRLDYSKKRLPNDHTLLYEDVLKQFQMQDGKCFYTGITLTHIPNDENILSFDRLDSSKSYSKDNLVLCTWRINQMKSNMLLQQFINLCNLVTSKKGGDRTSDLSGS